METRARPENLHRVDKPISNLQECSAAWQQERGGVSSRMFCTGIFGGRDSVWIIVSIWSPNRRIMCYFLYFCSVTVIAVLQFFVTVFKLAWSAMDRLCAVMAVRLQFM